jgi:hypothetical protein
MAKELTSADIEVIARELQEHIAKLSYATQLLEVKGTLIGGTFEMLADNARRILGVLLQREKCELMLRGKTEAETCRLNGWDVGTVLIGDEGRGPEKIKITAIGESTILARRIENRLGEQVNDPEGIWTLSCREWKSI